MECEEDPMRIKNFSDIRMGHAFRRRIVRVPDGNVLVVNRGPPGMG